MSATGDVGEPLSLEALLRHVSRLTTDLESIWVDALDNARRTAANERLIAEWSAVATAVTEITRGLEARMEGAGENPRLPALPPFASELSKLQVGPEPTQGLQQARMAILVAFDRVARAIGALTGFAEAHTQAKSDGDVEWESGAFSACRERAELLLRLAVLQAESERRALGSARVLPTVTSLGLARLALAAVAWGHGDPEASIVHLHIAARLIISDLLGVAPNSLPSDIADRLSARPALEQLAVMLSLAHGVVHAAAEGAEPDLTVATLLVPNLLSALSDLASNPPLEALREALVNSPTPQTR